MKSMRAAIVAVALVVLASAMAPTPSAGQTDGPGPDGPAVHTVELERGQRVVVGPIDGPMSPVVVEILADQDSAADQVDDGSSVDRSGGEVVDVAADVVRRDDPDLLPPGR